MNISSKTIDIMLSLDMSKIHIVVIKSRDSDATSSARADRRHERCSETFRVARSTKTADRHVTFQDIIAQRQAMIHSLFRQRSEFGRADNIDALNDRIARHERTISSYEKLSHRLKTSKKHQSMTSSERVMKLTKTNNFLLQKLAYHKDIRATEMRFLKKVIKLRLDMKVALTDFDCALKKRSKARADAKSILLNY